MMALLWSYLIVAPLYALSTILCGTLSVFVSLFDKTGRTAIGIARAWSRSLLWIARVSVTVEGLEKIDPEASYVFASNHLSYVDSLVALSQIPVQFRFLAKSGLFKIPFLGTHLAQAGHIPVPREDPRAAVKTLTLAAETIRLRSISLLIFPEGGRSEDGVLHEFKEGGAYIAIKAQVPYVPIAIIGTREILPMHGSVFHPGHVHLRIGDPMPTEGLTLRDRQALTGSAHEQVAELLSAAPESLRK